MTNDSEPTARRDAACTCETLLGRKVGTVHGFPCCCHESECPMYVAAKDMMPHPTPTDRDAGVDAVMDVVESYGRTCAEQIDPSYIHAAVRAAVVDALIEEHRRLCDSCMASEKFGTCRRLPELERQRGAQG